ncbi:hypothetical protein [Cytobacillus purgationiresistens]|uniref:Uncharacterized protein n=1 Tax=Cytobacillus purgationiresistens TaxID=863449 RepID=A0ABU0AJ34_9BACI|nr:hypothetical protein [Cytobacillus purgationiresistens]MDQ0270726.1 hypothetical protein [Cytobacillus purgationiresistens]
MSAEIVEVILGEIRRTKDYRLVSYLNDNEIYLSFENEGIRWKRGKFS